MGFVYDPELQLPQLFPTEASLANIDAALEHIAAQKAATNNAIARKIAAYKHPIAVNSDLVQLSDSFHKVRQNASGTHDNIRRVTSQIQRLDTTKNNLVLSMKVLKRLQMLINAYNHLAEVVRSRDYEQIASYLGAVRGLMDFFKPYKSIDEIAMLHQQIHQTQNKLVDDVFIDFEDSFTKHFTNDKLRFGCTILETIDPKYKDKLLTWFYNLQLKEVSSIFSSSGEAGSLENLDRRYTFFGNVLNTIQNQYSSVFPESWNVDLELSMLFSKMTSQEIASLLAARHVQSSVILAALTSTLAFERKMNDSFNTSSFTKTISSSFEPYLSTWVQEQDSVINSKMMELYSRPKLPTEIATPATAADLVHVLRVNNVPNFTESSVELFKTFQKSLAQTTKISSGAIVADLSRVFAKHLAEYHHRLLTPILQSAIDHPQGIEPIKYLTMIINTADYVTKNTNDLQDKILRTVDQQYSAQVDFDSAKSLYFEIIGKAIRTLVSKVSIDLDFSWRSFENKSWDAVEAVSEPSNYVEDIVSSLSESHKMICPLIIRDSYVRNYADNLIESLVAEYMSRLYLIKPLGILAVEQIMLDVAQLKKFLKTILLYSDPNYDAEKHSEELDAKIPKAFVRHLNSQFHKLETLLKLLLTPNLPVDNIVASYISLVGDQSEGNFRKLLAFKGITDEPKYLENFKLQRTMHTDLAEDSQLFSSVRDPAQAEKQHPSSQAPPSTVDIRDVVSSKSPEPSIPEFLRNNSKIPGLNFNNAFRDLHINGENHVNKLNENFKNIGKFFRKDE